MDVLLGYIVSAPRLVFNDLLSEENRAVTQVPMFRNPGKIVLLTHFIVWLITYKLQVYYGILTSGEPRAVAIWAMASANTMTTFFGSIRGFDIIILGELLFVIVVVFWCHMHYFYVVIIIMTLQVYNRLINSYNDEGIQEPEVEVDPQGNRRNNRMARNARQN